MSASFAVGSLARARGREWVVLPGSDDDWLMLRPLGGTDDEVTGVCLALERVESATFAPPDPSNPGDFRSGRLLRDALRLGFRSSAGPFRSFAHLGVEPRAYQLVPLMMALRLDPVRLLIADDVGIGKTVEAGLVLRELLDRGEVPSFAVLCPPHLAEQWQIELQSKFHLSAELVLSSTAARLERDCNAGESLFEHYPHTIVSLDFIKADKRRDEFLRHGPKLVIVDEAHTCATSGRGIRHQRHELLKKLAQDDTRHLILVTATPHSGDEAAFRSLLSLLDPTFLQLPEDLAGDANRTQRERVARHLVQRRRADIRQYLDDRTTFPDREEGRESDSHYSLSPKYHELMDLALEYARELVQDQSGSRVRQRVRWWSALALLRAIASSPAAAAATMRARAATLAAETPDEADALGARGVFDNEPDELLELADTTPGALIGDAADNQASMRLAAMAELALALEGPLLDKKLAGLVTRVKKLLEDGFKPIVFCRYIATAEYIASQLRQSLKKSVAVECVTGKLPASERETRVAELGEHPQRVLVATDCLSEGINLQTLFDAVIHYDLSWNPTRHEQREGRVDRYGQPSRVVRVLTYYGKDNGIDGIVLDVLLRKHKAIRNSLGVSVPVPGNSNEVLDAMLEGLLLRAPEPKASGAQAPLFDLQDYDKPKREAFFKEWENTSAKEKLSSTLFAQSTLRTDDVAKELTAVREAIGAGVNVRDFFLQAFAALGGHVVERQDGRRWNCDPTEVAPALREMLDWPNAPFVVRFDAPGAENEIYLQRTHPMVAGLAAYLLDTALDPLLDSPARRCGVVRTEAVSRRTTLLILRERFHLIAKRGGVETPLLAEDASVVAFRGTPDAPEWLASDDAEKLLLAVPSGNVTPEQAGSSLAAVVEGLPLLGSALSASTEAHAEALLAAHTRVREAARQRAIQHRVEAQLPPDVLGVFVYLPVPRV
ncbi:MAG TPA: helicase-related protein [Oscillatoriaceae cyanobacterium]